MVKILLKLTNPLQMDASDALGIALCHAHTQTTLRRMQARGVGLA
jgi:crossover junction endodeoxyribonuclease RuvC